MPYLQPPLTHSELQVALDVGAKLQGSAAIAEFLRWRTMTMVALIGGLATHQPLVVLVVTVLGAVLVENRAIPRMLAWENAAIIKVLSGGGSSRLQMLGSGSRQSAARWLAGFALCCVVAVLEPKSDVIATLFYIVVAAAVAGTTWSSPSRGIADAGTYSSWRYGSVDVPSGDDVVDVVRLATGTQTFHGSRFRPARTAVQIFLLVTGLLFLGAAYVLLGVLLMNGDVEGRYAALTIGAMAAGFVSAPFAARTAAKKMVRVAQDVLIIRSQNKRRGGDGMGNDGGVSAPH